MLGARLYKANSIERKHRKKVSWWYSARNGVFRKTRVLCSCIMCGNKRKWNGLTLQEIRQYLKYREGLVGE
jgi:hypothetical protein